MKNDTTKAINSLKRAEKRQKPNFAKHLFDHGISTADVFAVEDFDELKKFDKFAQIWAIKNSTSGDKNYTHFLNAISAVGKKFALQRKSVRNLKNVLSLQNFSGKKIATNPEKK